MWNQNRKISWDSHDESVSDDFNKINKTNLSSVQEANEILSSIEYSATLYDARPYLDHVTIRVIFESIQDHDDQDRSSSNNKKEALAQIPVKVTKIVIPGKF